MDQINNNNLNGKRKVSPGLNKYYQPLGLLLFCLVLGLGYYFLLQPQLVKIKELNNQQLATLAEAKVNQEYHDSVQKLVTKMQEASQSYQTNTQNLSRVLPSEPELPELFALYEDLAKQANFELESIDFTLRDIGEESKPITFKSNGQEITLPPLGANLGIVNISLKLKGGGYPEVRALLGLLEKNARLTDVLGLDISESKGETASYAFNLQSYYLTKANEKVGNK